MVESALGLIVGILVGNVVFAIDGYVGIAGAMAPMIIAVFFTFVTETYGTRNKRSDRRD
jgi:uncharacterized protein YacL